MLCSSFPGNERVCVANNFSAQEKVISEDLEKNAKRINLLYEENTEMKTKLADLEEENRTLEEALREIQKQSMNNPYILLLHFVCHIK